MSQHRGESPNVIVMSDLAIGSLCAINGRHKRPSGLQLRRPAAYNTQPLPQTLKPLLKNGTHATRSHKAEPSFDRTRMSK
jgi:hypothetical protein